MDAIQAIQRDVTRERPSPSLKALGAGLRKASQCQSTRLSLIPGCGDGAKLGIITYLWTKQYGPDSCLTREQLCTQHHRASVYTCCLGQSTGDETHESMIHSCSEQRREAPVVGLPHSLLAPVESGLRAWQLSVRPVVGHRITSH